MAEKHRAMSLIIATPAHERWAKKNGCVKVSEEGRRWGSYKQLNAAS